METDYSDSDDDESDDDISKLGYLDESVILQTLKKRFQHDKYYVSITTQRIPKGDTLTHK